MNTCLCYFISYVLNFTFPNLQFIQKPPSEPVCQLLLTLPGHCSMYLAALMHYLKQNLLQFLHTPNYVDSNPLSQFQDIIDGVWRAIPHGKVYLYNRPQPGGGKGGITFLCFIFFLMGGEALSYNVTAFLYVLISYLRSYDYFTNSDILIAQDTLLQY